jgi:hypothetical protein
MSTLSITLVELNKSVIEALKATEQAENKLKQAGLNCRDWFGSIENMKASKKQFQVDAIIPALDKKYQAWLKIDVKNTDKDSPEGKTARANLATARGFVASYYSKIEKHAFPSVKEDTEATKREPSLAFIEDFIKVAKKGQKLENAPFNLVKVMGFINLALKEMNVTSETDEV